MMEVNVRCTNRSRDKNICTEMFEVTFRRHTEQGNVDKFFVKCKDETYIKKLLEQIDKFMATPGVEKDKGVYACYVFFFPENFPSDNIIKAHGKETFVPYEGGIPACIRSYSEVSQYIKKL